MIPLYPSPLPRAIFTQGTKRLSEYIGHEAAVRAGTGYFMGLAVDHSREALVAGYLLIACTQSACPPNHFVKGQLQPACNGLGNVFRLIDERIASQQMALSIWKVSSPPSQIGYYGIHQWVDDSYYSHSIVTCVESVAKQGFASDKTEFTSRLQLFLFNCSITIS